MNHYILLITRRPIHPQAAASSILVCSFISSYTRSAYYPHFNRPYVEMQLAGAVRRLMKEIV